MSFIVIAMITPGIPEGYLNTDGNTGGNRPRKDVSRWEIIEK